MVVLAGLDQPDTRAYGPPYYVRQKSAAFNFGTTAYSDMQVYNDVPGIVSRSLSAIVKGKDLLSVRETNRSCSLFTTNLSLSAMIWCVAVFCKYGHRSPHISNRPPWLLGRAYLKTRAGAEWPSVSLLPSAQSLAT